MFFPLFPLSPLFAGPQHDNNKLLLELNVYEQYEQRPIAALVKSWVEILIKLQGTKSNIFLAQ